MSGLRCAVQTSLCAAKAYKKLSLLYHPDKTSGLTKEEHPICVQYVQHVQHVDSGSLNLDDFGEIW